MIKVGVIVPTRGDRPGFLDNCIRMINAQTFQPTLVHVVDYPPESDRCDITQRYRLGYDWFRDFDMDVLALMEDDDWYSPDYLATMVSRWLRSGRPDLFGTNYTLYYHIKLRAAYTMKHSQRSSAMSTLIRPNMNFRWCADDQPYTDSHLWFNAKHTATMTRLSRELFRPEKHICLGIKHGIGLSGGQSHTTELHRYKRNGSFEDPNMEFLRDTVDPDSLMFYENCFIESILYG